MKKSRFQWRNRDGTLSGQMIKTHYGCEYSYCVDFRQRIFYNILAYEEDIKVLQSQSIQKRNLFFFRNDCIPVPDYFQWMGTGSNHNR
jgi:hypothetical protein